MAFFQNLNKIVSSQLFTRPNSFILTSSHRAVFLENDPAQKIEYLHSVKALIRTIEELQNLRSNKDYAEQIERSIHNYEDNLFNYASQIRVFVKKGGLLTGEGIGNIYFSAQKLQLSPEWLEQNVHPQVIVKHKYMSRQNLIDTIAGLKKFHKASPYLSQLEQQLASRGNSQVQYVQTSPNNPSVYEIVSNTKSNHILINAILSGRPKQFYNVERLVRGILWNLREPLHSQ